MLCAPVRCAPGRALSGTVSVFTPWLCRGVEQHGSTAFLLACLNGQLAVARWLLEEKGVDYLAEKDNVSLHRHSAQA